MLKPYESTGRRRRPSRRHRRGASTLAILFLAFTIIPAVELYLLILIGQWVGPFVTVLIIMITGAIGAALAKREGFAVLRSLEEESRMGFPSGDRIIEGLMVLVGGILLITPGVLTDLTGFALIAPWTRRPLAPLVKRALLSRFKFQGVTMSSTVSATRSRPKPKASSVEGPPTDPFDHPVA